MGFNDLLENFLSIKVRSQNTISDSFFNFFIDGEVLSFPKGRSSLSFANFGDTSELVSGKSKEFERMVVVKDSVILNKGRWRFEEFKVFFESGVDNFIDLTGGKNCNSSAAWKSFVRERNFSISREISQFEKVTKGYLKGIGDKEGIVIIEKDSNFDLEFDFFKLPYSYNKVNVYLVEAFIYSIGRYYNEEHKKKNLRVFENVIGNLRENESLIFGFDSWLEYDDLVYFNKAFNFFKNSCLMISKYDSNKYFFIGLNKRSVGLNYSYGAYFVSFLKLINNFNIIDLDLRRDFIGGSSLKFSNKNVPLEYMGFLGEDSNKYDAYMKTMEDTEFSLLYEDMIKNNLVNFTYNYVEKPIHLKYEYIKYLGQSTDVGGKNISGNFVACENPYMVELFGDSYNDYLLGTMNNEFNLNALKIRYDKDILRRFDPNMLEYLLETTREIAEEYKDANGGEFDLCEIRDIYDEVNMDANVGKYTKFGKTTREVLGNPEFVNEVNEMTKKLSSSTKFSHDMSYNIILKPKEFLPDNDKKKFDGKMTARNIVYPDILTKCVFSRFVHGYKKIYSGYSREAELIVKQDNKSCSGLSPNLTGLFLEQQSDLVGKGKWYYSDISNWDGGLSFPLWLCEMYFFLLTVKPYLKNMVRTYFYWDIFKVAITPDGKIILFFSYKSTGSIETGFGNSFMNKITIISGYKLNYKLTYRAMFADHKIFINVLGDDALQYISNLLKIVLKQENTGYYLMGMNIKMLECVDSLVHVSYLSNGYLGPFNVRPLVELLSKSYFIYGSESFNLLNDIMIDDYCSKMCSYVILYYHFVEVRIFCTYLIEKFGKAGDFFEVEIRREERNIYKKVGIYNFHNIINDNDLYDGIKVDKNFFVQDEEFMRIFYYGFEHSVDVFEHMARSLDERSIDQEFVTEYFGWIRTFIE